jgi:hypothetical protein
MTGEQMSTSPTAERRIQIFAHDIMVEGKTLLTTTPPKKDEDPACNK